MNDDDSDKDKKKQSLLSHSTPASGTAAPRAGGSLLSAARSAADDAVVRHRLARSKREAAPSPLLEALAAMEGFRTTPTAAAEPQPQAEPVEETPSWWNLRNLLSPKVTLNKPKPAEPLQEQAEPAAPWPAAVEPAAVEPVAAGPVAEPPKAVEQPAYVEPEAEAHADEAFEHDVRRPTLAEEQAADDRRWRPLIDPLQVIGGIGSSKTLIATTTVLGALIGVAIALSTPKKYEAVAELIVDPRDLKVSDRDLTQTGLPSDATLALVENQVRVITSGTVLNKVVETLRLDEDPEFNGTRAGGIGNPFAILRALLSSGQSSGQEDRRHALAVSTLAESLTVERAGKTFIVTVSAKSEDPVKSADIVNTVNQVYLKTTSELQSDTAGRAATELSSRLDELRASLDEAERKAEKFRAEHDLIDAQGRLISDDELVKLNDQLAIARARTIELNARAASARAVKVDSVIGGALPEAMASPVMAELRAQYASIKQQADLLSVRVGPRHPQYLAMQAQLDGARAQIAAELTRIIASAQTELKRAVQQEQDLSARLAQLKVHSTGVNSDLITMRELERESAAKRAVYENYLLRSKEAGEQRDINTTNVSVISKAFPPLESTGASRATIAVGGAVLGFIAGVALGMMRGIWASLRQQGRSMRRPRPVPQAEAIASVAAANQTAADEAAAPAPVEALADVEGDTQAPVSSSQEEAAANPLVRLMQRFRTPAVVVGDKSIAPATTRSVPDPANAPVREAPANEEPAPMHPYPQQQPYADQQRPSHPQQANAYPAQQAATYPSPQPLYPQAPQAYPQQVYPPVAPYAQQAAPYMPQQSLPPYPPAFVQPAPYPPHFQPQPAAYPYASAPQPQPAFHGWQPQPAAVSPYGYPQPVAPQPYPPAAPQQAAYAQAQIYPAQPQPPQMQAASREMSPIEEVRESLREFREAIRDLAEDRARRRYS